MVTRSAPGFLLGLFVEAGTVVAALAVRPRAGRMIFPVPVLSYLVGALISGFVYNRSTGTSKTALAIGAAQWVADGFFAMALATVLAVTIITVRWYLWRRRRRGQPRPGLDRRPPPLGPSRRGAAPGSRRDRGRNPGTRPPAELRGARGLAGERPRGRHRGRGDQGAWNDADPRGGGRRPGRGREPGPTTSPAGRSGAPGA